MKPLADLLSQCPLPSLDGGKDASGTIVIIGGPATCPGGAMLAATAALRVGAGRVQLVVDRAVAPTVAPLVPELMVLGWDRDGEVPGAVAGRLRSADVVVIGPGCGDMDHDAVARVVDGTDGVVLLDAGALGAAPVVDRSRLVLAPNTAEAAELVGESSDDEGRLAALLVERFDRAVAVRGPVTVVADGTGAWQVSKPPTGLGTPGSGDVFAGTLAGMLAAGLPPVGALAWAVRLHADAGAHLAERTPVGYLASDVAAALPMALAAHHSSVVGQQT